MKSRDIAEKIAVIMCNHKKVGVAATGCLGCINRLERQIDDQIDIKAILAVARYLEPSTRSLSKITPLNYCSAFTITKLVLAAVRSERPV